MSAPTQKVEVTVICGYCKKRAMETVLPVSFDVSDDTWDDLAMHFALTMESDARHKAMCFDQFMPGVIRYVERLRSRTNSAGDAGNQAGWDQGGERRAGPGETLPAEPECHRNGDHAGCWRVRCNLGKKCIYDKA